MDRGEAAQLLTAGVGGASGGVVAGLLAVTGRWPVLLALVNGAVRADLNAGRRAEESMREILHELRTTGPTALDVTDADERHTAVARTIGVSLARLTAEQRDRYLELAVFGEDVAIPGPVLARYWKATGGWSAVSDPAVLPAPGRAGFGQRLPARPRPGGAARCHPRLPARTDPSPAR